MPNKKGYVKRFPFSETLGLLTLADQGILSENMDDNFSEKVFCLSCDISCALSDNTPGEGPLTVIIAHSDYTDAELVEWWLATNSWSTGDLVAREQARRKIRFVGTFAGVLSEEVLFNGEFKRIPLKFIVESAQTLELAVINHSGGTLTTGTGLRSTGVVWAKPV